jgi:hypothetical protein
MNVRKSEPPKTIERELAVELTRDEIFGILHAYLKQKMPTFPLRFDEIQVVGDPDGKLQSLELSGVEVIPINWDKLKTADPVTIPAANTLPATLPNFHG